MEVLLAEKSHLLAHKFADSKWLMQVAYLADMFAEINSLNISKQGHDQTISWTFQEIKSIQRKTEVVNE